MTVTAAMAVLNTAIEVIREQTGIDEKRHQQVDGPLGGIIKALGGVGDLYGPDGRPAGRHRHRADELPAAEPHADREGPRRHRQPGERRPRGRDRAVHDHDDHDGGGAGEAHEGDEHGHTHISSYLAPLAGAMGTKASRAVGLQVSAAWDEVDRGGQPSEGSR